VLAGVRDQPGATCACATSKMSPRRGGRYRCPAWWCVGVTAMSRDDRARCKIRDGRRRIKSSIGTSCRLSADARRAEAARRVGDRCTSEEGAEGRQ